ncbi:MAG: TolC family protein [Cyclobacteriaceae bacterium]|nr:TolC family protein [Cyclobacteriaceae bacterium HetDA_MAG_MS6]
MILVACSTQMAAQVRVLDLQECVNIAIENNITIKRSRLNKQGAAINLKESKAQRYPDLNLRGGYGYNWGRSIDPTTNQFITQQITTSNFGGSSNITLFSGLQIANSIEQRKLDLEVADYDLQKAENDVSLNIITFYLNVIFNKELLENARYQLQSSQNQLDRTQKLVASGALPITNELELISQAASNEVNVINAQNNLDLAMLSLKQAMLIPASENIEILIPDVEVAPGSLDATSQEIFDDAMTTQPEIKSADKNVESATLGVRVAAGAQYPTLSLSGGFSTNYSDAFETRFVPTGNEVQIPSNSLQTASGEAILVTTDEVIQESVGFGTQYDENLSQSLGINLNIPIFNGLRTSSNIQRSKINLQQAEITAQEQRNLLRQQIESSYTDALAASKTFQASGRQVEALQETFRAIENQYNLGAANFTDYQVASNNLFQAKSDLVRAKYDFIFKQKILDFYQGKPLSFN